MNSSRDTSPLEMSGRGLIDEALPFLQRLPIFSDTPYDLLKLYAYLAEKEQYRQGDIIMRQGEPCDRLHLIMSGRVAIWQEHRGRRFLLQELTSDVIHCFGELALIAEFDCFYGASALGDVEMLSFSRESFHKVMERYPGRYRKAVDRIVRLHIQRFTEQTNYLFDHLREEAWRDFILDDPEAVTKRFRSG